MSATVLYDAPGPRARARNAMLAVGFLAALAAVAWAAVTKLAEMNQLDRNRWQPFLEGTTWQNFLLPGLYNTLLAAALAIVIALPLGALFGVARLSEHSWISRPAGIVVEFFRAIPVLILMLFATSVFYLFFPGISSDERPLYAVVTGLVLYNASVLAEVVRAGIKALPNGQSEAAWALGMRKGQLMINILLPQAVTAMLPAIISQLIVIVKDTAIGGAMLGYGELINQARPLVSLYQGNTIATLVVIAAIFVVINLLLTWLASFLERRMRAGTRGVRHEESPLANERVQQKVQ